MADAGVVREFLVRLGFEIDGHGQDAFVDGVKEATKAVIELAAGAIGAASAVVGAVAKMAQAGEDLYFMSQRTKASVSNIQAFGFAASQMGSSVDAARASLEGLANFIRSNPGSKGLLTSLGVNPNEDTSKMMQDLGDRFAKMPQYLAQRYAGMMGIDIKTLYAMTAGMKEYAAVYNDMLAKAGLNSQAAAAGAHGFMVEIRTLGAAFSILAQKVGADLYKGIGNDVKNFRLLLVNNFQAISDAISTGAKFIVKFADVILTLIIRTAQAFNDLVAWYSNLSPHTQRAIKDIGLLAAAFWLLNKAILWGPVGIIVALGAALLLLYDDWKTWKAGGKHLIDWDYWDPEIRKAITGIQSIWKEIDTLITKIGGPNGLQHIFEAFALYVAGRWAMTMVAAFGRVGGAAGGFLGKLAPIQLALLAIDAWNKAQQLQNMTNYPVGSPLWRGIPEEQQKLFPNSPFNQQRHPTPSTALPSRLWQGAKKWLFGANEKTDVSSDVPPEGQALLDVIGKGESNGNYAKAYGDNPDINTYADHPGTEYAIDPSKPVGPGNQTSAVGKYQFEKDTWNKLAKTLGLKNMTPENQDKAAWYLAQQDYKRNSGGRDLLTDLRSKNYDTRMNVGNYLHSTWTSLGGSSAFVGALSTRLDADAAKAASGQNANGPINRLKRATGQDPGPIVSGPAPDPSQLPPILPGVSAPNLPPRSSGGGGDSAAANQNVVNTANITVHGAGDPHQTAKLIGNAQSRVNADLMRNLQTRSV